MGLIGCMGIRMGKESIVTNREIEVLQNTIARLKGDDRAAEYVREALTGPARLYIQTWIIAPLELLASENRTSEQLDLALSLSR